MEKKVIVSKLSINFTGSSPFSFREKVRMRGLKLRLYFKSNHLTLTLSLEERGQMGSNWLKILMNSYTRQLFSILNLYPH